MAVDSNEGRGGKVRSAQIAQTLDRGLVVLEALAASPQDLGVTELGTLCGLDKSTVCRMLNTLLRRGYVRQDPATRLYSLGLKILELYEALQGQLRLQEVCRPFLARLLEVSGETSHLAVLSGSHIVFVDWNGTHHVIGVRTQVGRREPAFCTALGKAILSRLSEEAVDDVLAGEELKRSTPKTVTSRRQIREQLRITADRGFAIDNEEFIEGVRCIASPVLNSSGRPVGALGLSGPTARLSLDRCETDLGPQVHDAAQAASRALGYTSA